MSDYPRVLYVEDDPMSRLVIDILLREQVGLHHLAIFEDSQDFIARVETLPFIPDIVLLDIHVKPIDGFEMLELLRNHTTYQSKPIVALTASVMNEDIARLKGAGFNGVLAKPIDSGTFPDTLNRLLKGESIWKIV